MKILHTADLHLGVKNSRLSKDKQSLLKDELLYNIRSFFDTAKKENFDIILICGDLFHSKNVTSKIVRTFFDAVKDFARPVVYISGNHDEKFVMPTELPVNWTNLDEGNYFDFGDFSFYNKNVNCEEINKHKNNILLLHGHIENTQDADYIDLTPFLNKGFDYIALGHVHQFKLYQKYKEKTVYSGTLFSNGFDECGEKGFVGFEIEDKTIKNFNYYTFNSRKYVVCECNISNLKTNIDIINKIEENLISSKVSYQDLVKVVLKGNVDEDCEKSLNLIENKFSNYFHFEIEDKSAIKFDLQKIKNEKLSFKYEFISLVENSDLDEESKRLITEFGLEALKGELDI